MSGPLQIGMLIFPKVTQLDFTGPLQVFAGLPDAKIHLIWKRIEPVASDSVLMLTPTMTYTDCPQLDVICVPGGAGADDLVNDEETLEFLRAQAKAARYVTSVCTGSLSLAALRPQTSASYRERVMSFACSRSSSVSDSGSAVMRSKAALSMGPVSGLRPPSPKR